MRNLSGELVMLDRIFDYIEVRENRQKVINFIGVFVIVGGVIFNAFMLVAIIRKW